MAVYKWKSGARFSADVELVAEEINALGTKDPHHLLIAAEDSEAELHKCFTWDDSKAAHMHRLSEARSLVRSVVVIDEAPDREPIEYRAFEYVIVQPENEEQKPTRVFVSTASALTDPDMRKQVLGEIKQAIGELSHKAKVYRYLAEQELNEAQHHLDLARDAVTV